MEKLTSVISTAVPLQVDNVDTDQVIPARFLKAVSREGFGEKLFSDWRYDKSGNPVSSFVLNDTRYSGKILLAGKNFGCGSSREHAAWALYDYGFRAVVSSFFADIFKSNALNNGLLPVETDGKTMELLFSAVTENPSVQLEIDIAAQTFSVPGKIPEIKFKISEYHKTCLMNGFDSTAYLLSRMEAIKEHEANMIIRY